MRAPRGLVFTVANFDQSTEDDRNFAFGLQQVRERGAEVSIRLRRRRSQDLARHYRRRVEPAAGGAALPADR